VVYRVSSPLPSGHWLNDPVQGGGRILGEACHMFDFVNWLCGTPSRVLAAALPSPSGMKTVESSTVTIEYANGSVATVLYSGVSGKTMPKERVEVMGRGRSWVLDDFTTLTSHGPESSSTTGPVEQDKGHRALMGAVLSAARGERPFEPGLPAAYAAQSVALAALESLAAGSVEDVVLP
jgi:predicted dehydrogenase